MSLIPYSAGLRLFSRLLAIGIAIAGMSGCQQDPLLDGDDFRDFYPIDSGCYVQYQVDSIRYRYATPVQFRDTVRYQWMEVIGDTFYDATGQTQYRVECWRRADSNASWQIDRIGAISAYSSRIEKVEDDVRYIRLVFPVADGIKWNGNSFAPDNGSFEFLKNWEYIYEAVNRSFTVPYGIFSSTCRVVETDQENLVEKMRSQVVYARDVGPIYREWERLQAAGGEIVNDWQNGRMDGFRIRWQLIGYGKK